VSSEAAQALAQALAAVYICVLEKENLRMLDSFVVAVTRHHGRTAAVLSAAALVVAACSAPAAAPTAPAAPPTAAAAAKPTTAPAAAPTTAPAAAPTAAPAAKPTAAAAPAPTVAPAAAAGGSILIGLITKTETNPFFVKMRESAQEQAKALNVQVEALAGKYDGDNEGQITAIQNLVTKGAKGILVTPSNSSGLLNAFKAARDKGVLVLALDTATDPADAVDALYATDNTRAGELDGQWAKKTMGDKPAKIAMLDGTPGGLVDTQRHDGFLKGFGISDSDPMIVGRENTNGDQAKGQTAMENLLQRNPDINLVYTINEPAAQGAYTAISARGKEKDILITSIDGGCAGVQNVKSGQVGATAMQFPKKMVELGMKAVVDFASSGKKPSGYTDTGEVLITDKPVAGIESQDTKWGLDNCWG
jgi:fructose transport system substrate-binding protein